MSQPCSLSLQHNPHFSCPIILPSLKVNETLMSLADWGCAKSLAAPLLADIKSHKIKVNQCCWRK